MQNNNFQTYNLIYLQLHVCLVNKDQGIDLIQLEASNSLTNLKSSKIALKHLAFI